jgi:hypothetical protein
MNPITEYNEQIEIADSDFLSVPTIAVQKTGFVSHFVKAVANGEIDPLELRVKFKAMQDAIEQVLKSEVVSEAVLKAFDNWGEPVVHAFGAEVVKRSRTIYDFKHDGIWTQIDQKRKDREKLLKAIKPGTTVYDTETGEEIGHSIKQVISYVSVTFNGGTR